MQEELKNAKGITLVALIITIIILLILAGVTISLVIGDNGLITKSKATKLKTRQATVEEKVELWKSENNIRENNGEQKSSSEKLIEELKKEKLVYDNEVNEKEETITIDNKVIDYSTIFITFEKTPSNELANKVRIRANVEGENVIKFNNEEEMIEVLCNVINKRTEEEKEQIIVDTMNLTAKKNGADTNFKNFQDVLNYMYEKEAIEQPTKESFINALQKEGITLEMGILDLCCESGYNVIGEVNIETLEWTKYRIINPDGENTNKYYATENGKYQFKIIDISTNKEYIKYVEVKNIGEEEKKIDIYKPSYGSYFLRNTETGEYIKFDDVYVEIKNKYVKLDKDEIRKDDNNNDYFIGWDIRALIRKNGGDAKNKMFNAKIVDKNGRVYLYNNIEIQYLE